MTGKPQALELQFDTAQFYDGGSRQSSNLRCYRHIAIWQKPKLKNCNKMRSLDEANGLTEGGKF